MLCYFPLFVTDKKHLVGLKKVVVFSQRLLITGIDVHLSVTPDLCLKGRLAYGHLNNRLSASDDKLAEIIADIEEWG